MLTRIDRKACRQIRHDRLRKKVHGTAERPRLSVFRSNKHIYAQLINDEDGRTLVSASTHHAEMKEEMTDKKKTEQAAIIGKLIGIKAKEAGISAAVFDRGGNKYHGRVKALCEAAREAGLNI